MSITNNKRIEELNEILRKEPGGGREYILFLDSIDSLEELEILAPTLNESGDSAFVDFYRQNLKKWPNPELAPGFKSLCPLLSAKLDTPQKVRVLLRAASFMGISPLIMGEVLENIIRRHEIQGENKVFYQCSSGDQYERAAQIATYTQMQAWTIIQLAFPESTDRGFSSRGGGCYIGWTT